MKAILPLILIVVLCAAASTATTDSAQSKALASKGGRFVFGVVGADSESYMLDTQSGRLWSIRTEPNGTNSQQVLSAVPYSDAIGKHVMSPLEWSSSKRMTNAPPRSQPFVTWEAFDLVTQAITEMRLESALGH